MNSTLDTSDSQATEKCSYMALGHCSRKTQASGYLGSIMFPNKSKSVSGSFGKDSVLTRGWQSLSYPLYELTIEARPPAQSQGDCGHHQRGSCVQQCASCSPQNCSRAVTKVICAGDHQETKVGESWGTKSNMDTASLDPSLLYHEASPPDLNSNINEWTSQ